MRACVCVRTHGLMMCVCAYLQSLLSPGTVEPARKRRRVAMDMNNKRSAAYRKVKAEVQAALKVRHVCVCVHAKSTAV